MVINIHFWLISNLFYVNINKFYKIRNNVFINETCNQLIELKTQIVSLKAIYFYYNLSQFISQIQHYKETKHLIVQNDICKFLVASIWNVRLSLTNKVYNCFIPFIHTLNLTPGMSPTAWPLRPNPATKTSSFSSIWFKQPSLGTKAVIFLPFLISCTLTHFLMAEFGCLASTPLQTLTTIIDIKFQLQMKKNQKTKLCYPFSILLISEVYTTAHRIFLWLEFK